MSAHRQYVNMFWGNEAGRALWLYKTDKGGLGFEIRGTVDGREQILAEITLERFKFDGLTSTIQLYREQEQ